MGWLNRARRALTGADEAEDEGPATEAAAEEEEQVGNTGLLDRIGDGLGLSGDDGEPSLLGTVAASVGETLSEGADWATQLGEDAIAAHPRVVGFARERAGEAWDDIVSGGAELAGDARRGPAWDGARELASDVWDGAGELASDVWDGARVLAGVANEGRERIRDAIDDTARGVLDEVGEAALEWSREEFGPDPLEFVDELQPGETRTFAVGGTVAGAGATVSDDVELSLGLGQQGGYTLTTGGALGLGGSFELGANELGGVDAEAMARGGARTEYRFDTPAEARRGADLLLRYAAHNSTHVISANRSSTPPDMTDEDMAFLREHVSALELSGEATTGISANAGPRLDEQTLARVGGVNLGANSRAAERVRIEWPEGRDGPTEVVLSTEVGGSGTAGASLGGSAGEGSSAFGASIPNLGAATAGRSVAHTRRFRLPPGTTEGDILSDPAMLSRTTPTEQLVVTDTIEGGAGGRERGETHTRTYTAAQGQLFDEDAPPIVPGAAMTSQALLESQLQDHVQVEERVQHFERDGVNLSAGPSLGPFRLNGRYRNQTTREGKPLTTLPETLAERRRRAAA